jgi:type II secretory pathway pseudopilin PulG
MKKILIGIGLVAVLALAIWASRVWSNFQVQARNTRFNQDIENLFTSLEKYKEKTGSYPVGSNAGVAKALNGQNAKGITVIVGRKTELNDKGEFVDQWGTPLRIYFSDNGVLIRSAGPNRRFDDSTVMDNDDFIRSN